MAIKKEMNKIRAMGTFERWDKGSADNLKKGKVKLPGFQQITCHMVVDVKMDGNFTRKARFVANGVKLMMYLHFSPICLLPAGSPCELCSCMLR